MVGSRRCVDEGSSRRSPIARLPGTEVIVGDKEVVVDSKGGQGGKGGVLALKGGVLLLCSIQGRGQGGGRGG